MTVGETLARVRQEAGLSIAQVSQRTRIRETVIRGIENEDFSPCGGDFYARGHIRSVAKAVGVDPDPLIHEYDSAHGGVREVSAAEIFEPATPIKIRERRPPNWSAFMALAIAAVIIYVIVQVAFGGSHSVKNTAHGETVHRPPAAASRTPSHSPTPAPTAQQRSVVIRLAANEDCWVGAYAPDGTQMWQEIVPAGATRTWTFDRQVALKLGNPGGITLTENGKLLGSLGTQPVTVNVHPGQAISG